MFNQGGHYNGSNRTWDNPDDGDWQRECMFDKGFQPGMKIMIEETFGPVAPVIRFETEEEAIRMANDTPYGLAAYVFTRDASRLVRVTEALEYGIIGANDGLPSTPQAPFGGFKESGVGREGGEAGLSSYLEDKTVYSA